MYQVDLDDDSDEGAPSVRFARALTCHAALFDADELKFLKDSATKGLPSPIVSERFRSARAKTVFPPLFTLRRSIDKLVDEMVVRRLADEVVDDDADVGNDSDDDKQRGAAFRLVRVMR